MKKWRDWFGGSARDNAASLPVDLTSAAFFADPAPIYDALRRSHPLAPVQGGGYLLTRHSDILAALTNPDLGNAPSRFSALHPRNSGKYPAAALAANIPPFLDRPTHIPARRLLSAAFFDAFKDAEPWVTALAHAHVAPHRGQQVDLIADIARPYACAVMARFIGLEMTTPQIKVATQAFFRLFAPVSDAAIFAEANAQIASAREIIAETQRPEGANLIASLAGQMSPQQVVDNAYLVLADGIENIEAASAMVFQILSQHRNSFDPAALTPAVTEALRLNSPAQILPRVAQTETTLLGTRIDAGIPVFLALGSANLDPDAHPDPLTFRPDRADAPVLTFGAGRHGCIGAQLGQLQIRALIAALLQAGAMPVDGQRVEWEPRFGHRWPKAFQVRLPPAA